MNPRLTFSRVNWKWSLPGLVLVALLAAFFNPPEPGVTSGDLDYVQRVVDGDTLLLGTGERVRLIGVNTPETVHPQKAVEAFGKEASSFTKRMVEGKLVRLEFDPLSSRRSGALLSKLRYRKQRQSHRHVAIDPGSRLLSPRGCVLACTVLTCRIAT